jgi:hypothetical protein
MIASAMSNRMFFLSFSPSIAQFKLHALLILAWNRSDGGWVDVQQKVSSFQV